MEASNNTNETIATSPQELLKLMALDLRYKTLTSFKQFKKYGSMLKTNPKITSSLVSNIMSEYLFYYASIERTMKEEEFTNLAKEVAR